MKTLYTRLLILKQPTGIYVSALTIFIPSVTVNRDVRFGEPTGNRSQVRLLLELVEQKNILMTYQNVRTVENLLISAQLHSRVARLC